MANVPAIFRDLRPKHVLKSERMSEKRHIINILLSDFNNLTQVHNFTVSAQDIFTFRRLSVFTVSFTRILKVLMQIMKRFALYY